MKKKKGGGRGGISMGVWEHIPPSPPTPLKMLRKSRLKSVHSGGTFEEIWHTKIHDKYQCCTFNLHSQIHHLNFHRKKSMLVNFFFHGNIFFRDFQFLFPQESSFPQWIPSPVKRKECPTINQTNTVTVSLEIWRHMAACIVCSTIRSPTITYGTYSWGYITVTVHLTYVTARHPLRQKTVGGKMEAGERERWGWIGKRERERTEGVRRIESKRGGRGEREREKCDEHSVCCAWFAHDCDRATWACVLETVRDALRRLWKKKFWIAPLNSITIIIIAYFSLWSLHHSTYSVRDLRVVAHQAWITLQVVAIKVHQAL